MSDSGRKPRVITPYGKPLHCPNCLAKDDYYGKLKLAGEKDTPCPNCGSKLIGKKR